MKLLCGAFAALLAISLSCAPRAQAAAGCGLPVSAGPTPKTTDALFTLRAAVGITTCPLAVCDVSGNGSVTAGDALLILKAAVGIGVTFNCPAPTTTTSSTSSTSSSSTSTSSTSTTTLPAAATWTEIQASFAVTCTTNPTCHGATSLSPDHDIKGLDDYDTGYSLLVGQKGRHSSLDLVKAGDAAQSYLMDKLDGTQLSAPGGSGVQMPQLAPPLSASFRNQIRAWIDAGAPKN